MDKKDIFKEQFSVEFDNFEAPLPQGGWDEIANRLDKMQHRSRIISRRWIYSGVAALFLLLLTIPLLLHYNGRHSDTSTTVADIILPRVADQNEATETNDDKNQSLRPEADKTAKSNSLASAGRVAKKSRISVDDRQIAGNDKFETGNRSASHTIPDILPSSLQNVTLLVASNIPKISSHITVPKDIIAKEKAREYALSEIEKVIRTKDPFLFADKESVKSDIKSKNRRHPIMLALNGRGSFNSYKKTSHIPLVLERTSALKANEAGLFSYYMTPSYNEKKVFTNKQMSEYDNVSEMDHAQPISWSITVSKQLSTNLSLETGLTYTYLTSKSKNINLETSLAEEQRFHYLGIPLNVNYTFLRISKLELFVSTGLLLEKDILGTIKRDGLEMDYQKESTAKGKSNESIKQNHLQSSVHAALGLSCPIYQGLGAYAKVGGGYYFDAKNPYRTIYSDKKAVLDFNIGLRYAF